MAQIMLISMDSLGKWAGVNCGGQHTNSMPYKRHKQAPGREGGCF